MAYDNVDVIEYYHSQGGDLNDFGEYSSTENLLMIAAAFGSEECLKFLLDNGADKEAKSDLRMSASEYAIKYENERIIKMLE